MKKAFLNFKAFILSQKSKTPNEIGKILLREAIQISSAESCTGGLISSRLTDVSGSSAYVRANFVTYSNEAKHRILNVSEDTLKNYGAVSEECAKEMGKVIDDMKLQKNLIENCKHMQFPNDFSILYDLCEDKI